MQRPEFGQPVFCKLADKAALSTVLLRLCCGTVVLFSVVASMMYIVALAMDSPYRVQNRQNVYYSNASLETASTGSSRAVAVQRRSLLLPETSATVGLHTVCISHNCVLRSRLRGVLPLVLDNTDTALMSELPSSVALAFKEVLNQFVFGYDIGESCGLSRQSTKALVQLDVAVTALSFLLLVAVFSVSMPLLVLLSGVDVLVGSPALASESHLVTVGVLEMPGRYVVSKVRQHLKWEQPLLTTLTVLSLIAFALNICSIASTVALVQYRSKCGQSVCDAFNSAMRSFYAAAEANNVNLSTPRVYTCRSGNAYKLIIVSFSLCGACCLLCVAMFIVHRCCHRGKALAAMRDQLRRLTEVQELAAGGAGDGNMLSQLSRRTSALLTTSSLQYSTAPAGGNASGLVRGKLSFDAGGGAARRRVMPYSSSGDALRQSRSIGVRIELYRLLKQFCAVEEHCRRALEANEYVGFQEFLAMREAAWFDEELCMLHRFTLDWFVGPSLDMCVLETHHRQQLIAEYGAGVGDVLAECGTRTRVTSFGSAPPRRDRAELNAKEGSLWEQRVRRCQQTHALMRHAFQRTASYDVAAAPARVRRALSAASTADAVLCSELNTDAWIRRLEELRTSYMAGPFLADPFNEQLRGSGAFWSDSEPGTACYSSPQTPGPTGLAVVDDFASVDAVRLHLCTGSRRSGASTSTESPSPRTPLQQLADSPPERLIAIPRHADAHGAVPPPRPGMWALPSGRVREGVDVDTELRAADVSADFTMLERIARTPSIPEAPTEPNTAGRATGGEGEVPHGAPRTSAHRVRGGLFGVRFGGKSGNGDSATRRSRYAETATASGAGDGTNDVRTPPSTSLLELESSQGPPQAKPAATPGPFSSRYPWQKRKNVQNLP